MSPRDQDVFKCGIEFLTPLFSNRFSEIMNHMAQNNKNCINEFLKYIDSAIIKAIYFQKQGKLKAAKYICITSLHTSSILKTYEYGIHVYDKIMFFSDVEAESYGCPSFIFKNIESDLLLTKKYLHKKFVRFQNYEMIDLSKWYISNYKQIAFVYLKTLKTFIVNLDSYFQLEKEDDLEIMYGEFMDQMIPLNMEVSPK